MLLYNHIELIYCYVPHILQVMSLTTSSLINTEAKNTEPGRQVFRTAFTVLSIYQLFLSKDNEEISFLQWKHRTLFFNAERQAGKLNDINFKVFGLTRPGIEPSLPFQNRRSLHSTTDQC